MIGQLLYYVLWILHFNIILSIKKFIFNKLLIYVFQSIFFFWKKNVCSHESLSHLMEKYSKKSISLFTSFKDTISSFINLCFQKAAL